MPEIAPSPDYGRPIDRPFNEWAMVLQAWGTYGTIWPVVHQWLGVRPDRGREELEVVPHVPPASPEISGKNICLTAEISSVTLDGTPVDNYKIRETNRGKEIFVEAPPSGEHTLVVETTS